MNEKLTAECKAAVADGDEATAAFLQSLCYTGMSLGMVLVISQLEAQSMGSLEGVLSLLKDHRDQWRDAAETADPEGRLI